MSHSKEKFEPLSWDGPVWNYDKENEAPWLVDAKGDPVISGELHCTEENARRIVVCINFMAGVSNAEIEAMETFKRERERCNADIDQRINQAMQNGSHANNLRQQRDELLAALKEVRLFVMGEALPTKEQALQRIDSVIAKVEGKGDADKN